MEDGKKVPGSEVSLRSQESEHREGAHEVYDQTRLKLFNDNFDMMC